MGLCIILGPCQHNAHGALEKNNFIVHPRNKSFMTNAVKGVGLMRAYHVHKNPHAKDGNER